MFKKNLCALAVSAAYLVSANTVQATENGGTIYQPGAENYTCCALPPPGVYGMVFGQHYTADKVRDNNGNDVAAGTGFKVTANAVVPRIVWITDKKVGEASLGFHAILPLVDLDVKNAPPGSQSNSGLGDMTFGPVLGWHHSPSLHSVLALDIYAPTGKYDQNDIANIGRNHWAIQPVLGVSYIQPKGLNADLKAMWTYNFKNDESFLPGVSEYKDGQELVFDYDLGWGLGNGWTVGVGGYLYKQITSDKADGVKVANNKAKAFAIGPSVRYDSGKGWFVTAKYQDESNVRNRADGSAFWLKAVFPL
ncbi:MAG: transporter [Neptuniibacter sp.]